jgi:hypothetical protein
VASGGQIVADSLSEETLHLYLVGICLNFFSSRRVPLTQKFEIA